MKTGPLFLFLFGLLSSSAVAGGLMTGSDTTKLAQPDSAASVQPDSTSLAEPSLTITGNLELTKEYYAMLDSQTSHSQNSPWYLNGTLILTTRTGWTIPLQGVWSTPTSGYEGYNAIGFSPRYKNWLTLHGGYRNVEFSPLTLAGHSFLGAGIEMNAGLLRVGLIAGRFNRAIEPTNSDPDRAASFRRMGYCAKLGIGNDHTYLDVILLRVADDASSIRADSAAWLSPAENVVLGLSGRIQANRKLTVELDAAGSAYTSDTRTPPLPTSDANDNRLLSQNYLNGFERLITVRPSTIIRTALQASFSYRTTWADLKLRYKRVEPGYQSMGTYYLQTDVERITVAPTIRLLKKRLQLRSSVGWQHDNLFNQKRIRTNRLIGSVSVSYASDQNLTLELTASNYGITQRAGYRPLNDSARVAQNNRTLSGNVFKCWAGAIRMHSLNGSVTYQELQDMNLFTIDRNHSQNWNYALNYTFQQSAAGLHMNINYNYSRSRAPELSFLMYGPTVSVEKKMGKDRKLSIGFTVSYLKNKQSRSDADQQSVALNTTLTLDYQLTPVHRLSVSGSIISNQGAQYFRQQQGTVQYNMVF